MKIRTILNNRIYPYFINNINSLPCIRKMPGRAVYCLNRGAIADKCLYLIIDSHKPQICHELR